MFLTYSRANVGAIADIFSVFLSPWVLEFFEKTMRKNKGHRYIVLTQGPPEPMKDTQAMPRKGHCSLRVLSFQNWRF
jgi:hypothetical protein